MTVTVEMLRGSTLSTLCGGSPYWFLSLTGAGMAPVRRQKERGPQQHGSTDVGFLLDERYLNLAILIQASTLALADTARDALVEILKPVEDLPCKLRITRDDAAVRQIDCNVIGAVDFPNTIMERQGPSQLLVVQFEAADPVAYDPTLKTVTFNLAFSGDLQVPLQVPMVYSSGVSIDSTQVLAYAGKWEAYPTIYIDGPATDVVITNNTLGLVLDFTGTTIPPGLTYIVTLDPDARGIVDSNGVNRIAALTTVSHFSRWRIAAPPVAASGNNSIRVEMTGATGDSEVRFEYYDNYLSF